MNSATTLTLYEDNLDDQGLEMYVPYCDRFLLTIPESSQYFGIGENRLRAVLKSGRDSKGKPFTCRSGNHRGMVERERFQRYLDSVLGV